MNVAIIPARGGSKRIPRKNVLDFNGKPMIWWPIQAALASGCFARVVVSTDDPAIAEVARAGGAETPFLRPAVLANDHTPTVPVVRHALEALATEGYRPEAACCIYATAPLIDPSDLRVGLELLESSDADYAISVTTYPSPIQRALSMDAGGLVRMMLPEYMSTRSQELPEAWHDAGQFYWGSLGSWLQERQFFAGRSVGVKLPRSRVQDIDTIEDWSIAEALMAWKTCRNGR